MTDRDSRTDRFDAEFREWAREPPRTPAQAAARRVTARLGEARPHGPTMGRWAPRVAVACGLALIAASGVLLWRPPAPAPPASATADAPPVLPDNVVVFWLDPETPVYFVVAPIEDIGGTP